MCVSRDEVQAHGLAAVEAETPFAALKEKCRLFPESSMAARSLKPPLRSHKSTRQSYCSPCELNRQLTLCGLLARLRDRVGGRK